MLSNLTAALRLIEDTEKAIINRLKDPLIYDPYRSAKDRKTPYYRIRIRNFSVFYVVIDDVMEVRLFLYSKRDLPKYL